MTSYQLSWRSHSSVDVLTASVFNFFLSFFIRINCLTVLSSLKFIELSQVVVCAWDCRRLCFLIIERIRWKLLSSLDPSPTSCETYENNMLVASTTIIVSNVFYVCFSIRPLRNDCTLKIQNITFNKPKRLIIDYNVYNAVVL